MIKPFLMDEISLIMLRTFKQNRAVLISGLLKMASMSSQTGCTHLYRKREYSLYKIKTYWYGKFRTK